MLCRFFISNFIANHENVNLSIFIIWIREESSDFLLPINRYYVVSVRRGFVSLLRPSLGRPYNLTTQSTDFGYLLELLHIETFRTSTYNLNGLNVHGFKWTFLACLK